ncbi:MAG: hypothetical protein WAK84_09855 [Candidatus Cybelea sp.]
MSIVTANRYALSSIAAMLLAGCGGGIPNGTSPAGLAPGALAQGNARSEHYRGASITIVQIGARSSIQHLALLAALGGDAQLAARLLGYVDVGYDQLGMKREPTEQWGYDKLLTALRKTLSDDEIKRFAAEGAAWSEDQAVEKALKI